jgi:prepilin-type N-terminal cleavage/methylation domain-containing protein
MAQDEKTALPAPGVSAPRRGHGARRRGFTIIELLTVMLIIGILSSITVWVFVGAMQAKNIRSTQLCCLDLQAAVQTYFTQVGALPFDVKNITDNQNWVMVDNMTNASYRWVQQRGNYLETQGGQYRFSQPAGPQLREVLDHWGSAYVIKVVDPGSTPSPSVDHLTALFGSVKVLMYSIGPDAVDQGGGGNNDDIGPGGCVKKNF